LFPIGQRNNTEEGKIITKGFSYLFFNVIFFFYFSRKTYDNNYKFHKLRFVQDPSLYNKCYNFIQKKMLYVENDFLILGRQKLKNFRVNIFPKILVESTKNYLKKSYFICHVLRFYWSNWNSLFFQKVKRKCKKNVYY